MNQRNNHFTKSITHGVRSGDWQNGTTLSCTVTIDVRKIRLGRQSFLAPLTTDDNLNGFISKRAGEPEVTHDGALNDRFLCGTGQYKWNTDIARSRLRYATSIEHIIRNARRVATGTNRICNRAGNQQCFIDPGARYVVTINIGDVDLAELRRHIIAPIFGDIALHAGNDTELVEADVVETRTAFNVTLTNQDIYCVCRANARTTSTIASCGSQSGISKEEWVVTVYRPNAEKCARGSNLGFRAVIHEHRVKVWNERFVDFILCHHAGSVTLRRTTIIIQRSEVECIAQRNIRYNRVGIRQRESAGSVKAAETRLGRRT